MWSRHKTNITFIISPVCASISKETMKQQVIDIYNECRKTSNDKNHHSAIITSMNAINIYTLSLM